MKRRKKSIVWLVVALCSSLYTAGAEYDLAPQDLYTAGLAKFSEGDYIGALSYFETLVNKFGEEAELRESLERVHYAMGCCYFNNGDMEGAAEAFGRYMKEYPKARFYDEALFRVGSAYQNLENYDKAIDYFQRLEVDFPTSPFTEDGLFQVGLCHTFKEDHEQAVQSYKKFIRYYPSSDLAPHASVLLGRSYLSLGTWRDALEIIKDVRVEWQSADYKAQLNFLAMEIGDIAFDETEYDLALQAYRRVRTKEHLIRTQREWMDLLQRRLSYINRQRIDPKTINEHFRLKRRIQSSLSRAGNTLDELIESPNHDALLYHRIGRCFFNNERYWEARVAFTRVVEDAVTEDVRESGMFDLVMVLARQRKFPKTIAQADVYLSEYGEVQKYIDNNRVPTIGYIRAEAFINDERFEEAEPALRDLMNRFPEHNQLARIEFYLALSLAMQEQFAESIEMFERWLRDYPNHIMHSDVRYWLAVALYYSGNHGAALPRFVDYANQNPLSIYTPEAEYRSAMCMYSLEQFQHAADTLESWLRSYPDHHFVYEALITRGDALAAIGKLEEARASYLEVSPLAGPYYYMSLQRCAKVYKALDDPFYYKEMAAIFEQFIHEHPDSLNVVDAAYQAGSALRQINEIERARKLYWDSIERYGNRTDWEGFTPLFDDLRHLYGGDAVRELERLIENAYRDAYAEGLFTLAVRYKWALARLKPLEGDELVAVNEIESRFDKEHMGAEELVAISETLLAADQRARARPYYEYVYKTFPKSRYLALALIRMAEDALAEENVETAFALVDNALQRAMDPEALIRGVYVRARCLHALERYEDAIHDYTQILAHRTAPRPMKPEAMLGIADCYEKNGELTKAVPYYQRIYVLYGAFSDAVAKAYWRSGQAFEEMNDYTAASRTYREMVANEALAEYPEFEKAKARLAELGEAVDAG